MSKGLHDTQTFTVFRAIQLVKEGDKFNSRVAQVDTNDLPPGNVTLEPPPRIWAIWGLIPLSLLITTESQYVPTVVVADVPRAAPAPSAATGRFVSPSR